jgi:hypothetical protein
MPGMGARSEAPPLPGDAGIVVSHVLVHGHDQFVRVPPDPPAEHRVSVGAASNQWRAGYAEAEFQAAIFQRPVSVLELVRD